MAAYDLPKYCDNPSDSERRKRLVQAQAARNAAHFERERAGDYVDPEIPSRLMWQKLRADDTVIDTAPVGKDQVWKDL